MPKRTATGRGPRWGWRAAAALAVAVVLWFTLREDELVTWSHLTGRNFTPLRHHLAALRCVLNDCEHAGAALHYLVVDVVGNVLLFLPVGFTVSGASRAASAWRRFAGSVLFACVLSVGIESLQLVMPSRASDVDDVLFNTLGAFLGALLVLPFDRPRRRRRVPRRAAA